MKTAKFWVGVVLLASAPILLPVPYSSVAVTLVLFMMLFGISQHMNLLHDRLFQLEEQMRRNARTI